MKTEYIIRTSCAQNKGSWKWQHKRRHVAVMEVEEGVEPKMISERAKGVVQIVCCWSSCYVGVEGRCSSQYTRAIDTAENLIARLNLRRENEAGEAENRIEIQQDLLRLVS